jgi:hypothetical protein
VYNTNPSNNDLILKFKVRNIEQTITIEPEESGSFPIVIDQHTTGQIIATTPYRFQMYGM